jgi:hypothetical protein
VVALARSQYDPPVMGPGRSSRAPRGAFALAFVVAVIVASSAPASASERVLSRWTLTVSGTIRHTWSLPDSTPCLATGDGSVSVRFATTHPERITIADNGYGPGDISWNDELTNIAGTLTATDSRTRNPPAPVESSCSGGPVPDTRSCGTYHFHSGLFLAEPVRPRRSEYELADLGNFTQAAHSGSRRAENCETDGFHSFAYIGSEAKAGAEDLKLPGYPTPAQMVSRHGRIVISVTQTHRWVPGTLTVRNVRVVLTRVR